MRAIGRGRVVRGSWYRSVAGAAVRVSLSGVMGGGGVDQRMREAGWALVLGRSLLRCAEL